MLVAHGPRDGFTWKRLAKGLGRAVIAVPTFGLTEVYYAARQD